MSGTSRKSKRKISEDTRSTISSQASASGVTPFEELDGQMIFPCGLEAAPARVSVRAGKGQASTINVTYGLHGSGSFESRALTSSLVNRYRREMASHGSTLFRLIWKARRTPSGRWIPALRALARPTSGNDCTSWASPDAESGPHGPRGTSSNAKNQSGRDLQAQAKRASWPSPMAGSKGTESYNEAGNTDSSRMTVRLASWPTPNCDDPNNATRASGEFNSLTRTASWTSPAARDYKDTPGMAVEKGDRTRLDQLPRQAHLSGKISDGTTAAMDGTGPFLLNPRFSLWLQGLPEEWASCAERAMHSARRRRKRSSGRT